MEKDYLDELFRTGRQVRIFVTNGYQLRGRIDDVGMEGLILECECKRKLVFYHAISTVEPM